MPSPADGDKTAPERELLFPSTHWSVILQAGLTDSPDGEAALDRLLGRYWRAVYCYLLSKGYDHETAKDRTQGFLCEIVLGRGLVRQADRKKGRFRTFLLTALNHYLVSMHRAEKAKHRVPEKGFVSLQNMKRLDIPSTVHGGTPAEVFDYAWASALLDQVIADLAETCRESRKESHWDVFRERVLLPILENSIPPSLPQLCQKYGIPTQAKASRMICTTKDLFGRILRSRVRELVESDDEVDGEIRDLIGIFSAPRARL